MHQSRQGGRIEALLQVADWFRSEKLVAARAYIYGMDRNQVEVAEWGEQANTHVSEWVGYLDVVATLVLSKSISRRDLIRMYGDVIFRTVYMLAPTVNHNSESIGSQYLKSTKVALPMMIDEWDRLSKTRRRMRKAQRHARYPRQILMVRGSGPNMSPDEYRRDEAIIRLVGR
jgi:hypothetical protein